MENVKIVKTDHKIVVDNRKRVNLTGVTQVHTFNEEQVNLTTIMGALVIRGKELKVNKLSVETGEVSIDGEFISLTYISKDEGRNESFLKKLFK
ncbi:Spore protein YabP [Caloramator mitchellensis]|uniref:Spore protein YabP n=1 Tax=Caloramator mitchellensis TaxID=908809 RepID=A0A0R3JT73_CALMK|nr:sporulation protein YabP [Caloramator mitchellensis]KRQ86680.1 Spore protein YabP [Caloramator mitchellensis]